MASTRKTAADRAAEAAAEAAAEKAAAEKAAAEKLISDAEAVVAERNPAVGIEVATLNDHVWAAESKSADCKESIGRVIAEQYAKTPDAVDIMGEGDVWATVRAVFGWKASGPQKLAGEITRPTSTLSEDFDFYRFRAHRAAAVVELRTETGKPSYPPTMALLKRMRKLAGRKESNASGDQTGTTIMQALVASLYDDHDATTAAAATSDAGKAGKLISDAGPLGSLIFEHSSVVAGLTAAQLTAAVKLLVATRDHVKLLEERAEAVKAAAAAAEAGTAAAGTAEAEADKPSIFDRFTPEQLAAFTPEQLKVLMG